MMCFLVSKKVFYITRYFGKLLHLDDDNNAIVHLDSDVDKSLIDKFTKNHNSTVELNINDGRTISSIQRRKIFAMLHDISMYTGFTLVESEQLMKFRYMAYCDKSYFSLSDTSVSNASYFIEFLIVFCFQFDIPFKWKTYESIKDSYTFQKRCLLQRKCIICGKHADIDHIKPIGMGRDRKHHVDNTKFTFEALCRYHHQEKHHITNMKEFANKYHIIIHPIKLNEREVRMLNIGR